MFETFRTYGVTFSGDGWGNDGKSDLSPSPEVTREIANKLNNAALLQH